MITAREAREKYNKSGAEINEILVKICDKISCVSNSTTRLTVFFKWCVNKTHYDDFKEVFLVEMRTKGYMSNVEVSAIMNELKKLGYVVISANDGELSRFCSSHNNLDYVGEIITIKW